MAPGGMIQMYLVGDDRGVARMLMKLDTALSPPAVAAFLGSRVEPYLQSRAKDRFANEGDDVVGAWTPLSDATQEIRAQMGIGPAGPINKRTGELEDFITNGPVGISIHPMGATLTMPSSIPNGMTGELKDKFTTAQSGREDPRTVARPVLGMNERDLANILTQMAFYVQRAGMTA